MSKFIIKSIESDYIEQELEKIGFDATYRHVANDKFKYKNIKIFSLSLAQANILKQTALSLGADCATHKEVITGNIEKSDAILTGSYSQLRKIALKLEKQPFSLNTLGKNILDGLNQNERKTKIVGILNVTPDSFSDGGKYLSPNDAIKHFTDLVQDGADMIDIGAESTRPYSQPVSDDEQIERLKPILEFIQRENLHLLVSVDTRSSVVADFALNMGVNIINDVSGFEYDKKLPEVVSKYKAGVIIQHSAGNPQNMQDSPAYDNLIDEIYFFLREKAEFATSLGIENIIVDPGIGFGKTKEHNMEIIDRAEEFYSLNLPVMIGISRKGFLCARDYDNGVKDALTVAVSYPLVQKRIDYLRVHNVKLHRTMLKNI